jgi:lysyl-tRNA synthetase class 1
MTDGGSYDVSSACLQAIYGTKPPAPIPYEFFLVGGAKMSSSRGVGSAAREIADLLPPELLRFLVLRTEARQPVSFAADEKNIEKLFNDFDRVRNRVFHVDTVSNDEKDVYRLSQLTQQGDYYAPSFSLLLALLQLPHLNLQAEVERRKGGALTEVEQHHLEARLHTARLWLEKYTSDEDRLTIHQTLPASVAELTAAQRGFLHRLAETLPTAEWEDDALQTLVFDTARITPLEAPKAFQAVYRALLDRDAGPKAGSLLAFLDRDFIIRRCQETPFSRSEFWSETAVSVDALSAWLEKVRPNLQTVNTSAEVADGAGVMEVRLTALEKGEPRTHVRRVLLTASEDAAFREAAEKLASSLGLPLP